jgi:hypothetical protein
MEFSSYQLLLSDDERFANSGYLSTNTVAKYPYLASFMIPLTRAREQYIVLQYIAIYIAIYCIVWKVVRGIAILLCGRLATILLQYIA